MSRGARGAVTDQDRHDARILWAFHLMDHDLVPCDVAIGLGSHDLGVATHTAELFHAGLFEVVVFTGATSPTTRQVFPHGEAVHYRERAVAIGVPADAILVEPAATNTGANFALARAVLAGAGVFPRSAVVVSKLYAQRRAYATAKKVWPELDVVCSSEERELADHVASIGDERTVIDMIVGEMQRILRYPRLGFTVEQRVPEDAQCAYQRLVARGFDSRLIGVSS